ncbi:hypothetical protein COO59_10210 [Mixta theicola]|uniref:Fimbrial protein n=1 Tax=Mixta theicola TaxID=1458355 RepID=A0A2K1Q9Z1_9GAMM|nr:hypothetical protein [Mixta theicola]PNS11853.1 hypothetical protein COO59_10210 [Mixta theicola]GLR07781.1 hypothetical protein GCM10007905_05000 [Mixta theicola]
MKYLSLPAMLIFMTIASAQAARSVKTTIDIVAEINTSVRVYVEGQDVTNGVISLRLEDKNGYMSGVTPAFQFVGNASGVSLMLYAPSGGGLLSENNDLMKLNNAWIRSDGQEVSSAYPLNNQPVYPTLQDIPDMQQGVKVRFSSANRSETYPLGSYSGSYEVIVTPSV